MIVDVHRSGAAAATTLLYRGSRIGIGVKSQIEDAECDGRPLAHSSAPDAWDVPSRCKTVRWRVRFDLPGAGDATAQRSVASADGSFRLISQASSLAVLADDAPGALLSVPRISHGVTLPKPQADGTLALPTAKEPPLFLLLGSTPVSMARSSHVTVRYFLDDRSQQTHLAPIKVEIRGLEWLESQMPETRRVDLNYAWLGAPADAASMGGATGTELMMVNYVRGGSDDSMRAAVTALVPLIEGAHHLSHPFGSRNGWAEESLATYFGLQALRHARPRGEGASALMARFIANASHFPLGLIDAQHHVARGDQAAYPTYFTKGVAFWSAVDSAIRTVDASGLGGRRKACGPCALGR